MKIVISVLLLSMLFGCSLSPHSPTSPDLSVKIGGSWLGSLAELFVEQKATYKISDKATDMVWIEHVIDLGQKQGSIKSNEERAWVRKLYADKLISPGNIPSSLEETKKVLEKYSAENPPPIEPYEDGNDVLLPQFLIEAIDGYDLQKPVYAASDNNGWLVSGVSRANLAALVRTEVKREGYVWRAKNMKGERFNLAQLKNPNLKNPFIHDNVGWSRIERVYSDWGNKSFIDSTGPCFLIK